MKKIIISLGIIAVVAVAAIGGTIAYFSDTEMSTAQLTAGIIDIVVDGQNPWSAVYEEELRDMKPSYTKYIEFTVRNLVDSNPVDLWKHIHITDQNDGVVTEPECEEGNGTWNGSECGGSYVPRNNLASYIVYDMHVCEDPEDSIRCLTDPETGEPIGGEWQTIIDGSQYIRLDNISSSWIYLGQLNPAKELKVVQSYHLTSWPDAPEPEVTNWAQGDVLTFSIELMATQENGPGPEGAITSTSLDNKDPVTWEPISDTMHGQLTYYTSGPTFDYNLTATGLVSGTEYSLIYYADPYPGNNPGALIATYMANGSGVISALGESVNLNLDLPDPADSNYPAGAKIWLVPSSDYDAGTNSLTVWNPTTYLFEIDLITYDDTDL